MKRNSRATDRSFATRWKVRKIELGGDPAEVDGHAVEGDDGPDEGYHCVEIGMRRRATTDAAEGGLVVDEEQEDPTTEELAKGCESGPDREGLVGGDLSPARGQRPSNIRGNPRLEPELGAIDGEESTTA